MLRIDVMFMVRLLACWAVCVFSSSAWAQDAYPSKPIHMVVPQAPGGGTDLMARQVSERLAKVLNVPVVVDNRPGGDSNIAASYVVREPADGYTLLFANSSLLINHVTGKSIGFSFTDLTPLALLASAPFVLVVNPATPANNVAELVAYSKKNPGTLNHASTGLSTTMLIELFKRITSLDVTDITYRSGAQSVTAILGDQTHMMFASLLPLKSFIASGRLKAIGVAGEERLPAAPQVPTFREQGVDFVIGAWWAVFVSAKTPALIIARLDSAVQRARADQGLQDILANQGAVVATGDQKSFQKFLDSEAKFWQKIVKDGKLVEKK